MTVRVGVDGSGPSRAALAWALARAADLGEPVVLTHVVDDEWGQLGGEYAQREESDWAHLLDEALDLAVSIAPDLEITSRLSHGSTAWSLAEGVGSGDLIVVGTHKTGYLRGRILGTRSIVVASVAPCSVAVIPDIDLSGRSGIVAGVAEGDAWPAAVITGAHEAERLRQNLSLIHAADNRAQGSSSRGRELLAAAAAVAAAAAAGISIRSRISTRRPAEALLDASHDASILVLGTSRREPGRAGLIGSVIHDVLLNANAPVLVTRLAEEHPISGTDDSFATTGAHPRDLRP